MRQEETDRRLSSGAALNVEAAAEQTHSLAHPNQAHSAALGCTAHVAPAAEPSPELLEAAGHDFASSAVHVLGPLGVCEPDVGGQGAEFRDRPVVKIEAKSKQPLLAGLDKGALALGVPLEEHFALQPRRQQRRRLF